MKRYLLIFSFVIPVALLSLGCGGGGGGGGGEDTTAPTVLSTQPAAGPINAATDIVIIFDESMDVGSLLLGGDLGLASDNGNWTDTTVTNDTLTIGPNTAWTEGADQTLSVQVTDAAGNSLTPLDLLYTVDTTAPTGSEFPADGSTLSDTEPITIIFDESMSSSSLTLGGDLGSQAHNAVWSSTISSDDTLAISPSVAWSDTSLSFSVDAEDLAGNPLVTINLSYPVSTAGTTASVSPLSYTDLPYDGVVTVTFSRSMDTGTLVLGGTLAGDSGSGIWSDTTHVNDTLQLSPAPAWTGGIGKTLSIDADDLSGNPIATANLVYNVDDPVYVSGASGNDGWSGTKNQPKKTIGSAITTAVGSGADNVHIMAGNYQEVVVLQGGISLTGGYDSSWTYGDYSAGGHTVRIQGGTSGTYYVSVKAQSITSKTKVTNLIVDGPSASGTGSNGATSSSYGVYASIAPGLVLENLRIEAGNGANGSGGTSGSSASQTRAPGGSGGGNGNDQSVICDDTTAGSGGSGADNPAISSDAGGDGGKGGPVDTYCSWLSNNYWAQDGDDGFNAETAFSSYGYGGAGGYGHDTVAQDGFAGNAGRTVQGTGGVGGIRGGSLFDGYLGVSLTNGSNGTIGQNGTGGGGGGGGGACDANVDDYGAGGGGGGSGGARAPVAGTGGKGGGASVGLIAVNSTGITVGNVIIDLGNGGNGGSGGNGGYGQPGGFGGSGGSGFECGGAGGSGGNGGGGGDSGGGGGGAGGNSHGILTSNTSLNDSGVTYNGGSAGTGGSGGTNTSVTGVSGQSGVVSNNSSL